MPKKTLSGPVTAICILLFIAVAFRSLLRMRYWWDHSNTIFSIWQGAVAGIAILFALAFGASFFRSTDAGTGILGKFFSQDSPLIPAAAGLMLIIAGAYGMLFLVTEDNVAIDWGFFGSLLGCGIYVLKRTFSMEN